MLYKIEKRNHGSPMKTKSYISAIALLALLVGCTTTIRPYTFEQVAVGMDKAQVEKLIGEPDRIEAKDGAEFLYYSYNEDYNPTGPDGGFQTQQAKRSMKTRNYVIKLVDGKVATAEEAASTSTL